MKTATSSHAARQRDVRAMGPYEGRGLLSHSGPWPPLHTATSAKRFRVQGDGAGQEQEGEAGGASVRDGEMRGLYLSAPRKYEAPAAAEPKRQLPWPAQWREGSGKVDVPAQPGVHGRGGADGRHLSEPQLFPRWPSQALLVDARAPAEQARLLTQMRDLTSLT